MVRPASTALQPLLHAIGMPSQSLPFAADALAVAFMQALLQPIDRFQPLFVALLLSDLAQPRQPGEMSAVLGFHLHEFRRALALFGSEHWALALRSFTPSLRRLALSRFTVTQFTIDGFGSFRCAFAASLLFSFASLTLCFCLTSLSFCLRFMRTALTFCFGLSLTTPLLFRFASPAFRFRFTFTA